MPMHPVLSPSVYFFLPNNQPHLATLGGFHNFPPNRTNSWVADTVTVNDNNNNNTTTRINLSRATGDARDGGKKIKTTSAGGTLSSSTRCWFLRTRHKRQHPVPVDDRA